MKTIFCTLTCIGFATQLALGDLPVTYTNPSQAKQLIQRALRLPQSQNDTKVFYADGISHFDSFIPVNRFMKESAGTNKYSIKFTYHDGRISSAETMDDAGRVIEGHVVWNNSAGAPVLSAYRNREGGYDWYMYAEYDSSGKIQTLYRFNQSFELQFYYVFSYAESVTSIQEYGYDSQPRLQEIYDHGDVYVVENGVKRLVNHADRKQEIRQLEKFGLKPLYPAY